MTLYYHVLRWIFSWFAEYTDDEAHIPKHSSVIVRRTPLGGVKPAGRTFIVYVLNYYWNDFWEHNQWLIACQLLH